MPDATWKAVERRVARALGGRRVGNTGRDTPDVDAGWLVAEVKHRRTLPRWILEALAKARRQAGSGRLGVAVLHEHQAHDSLVVMSLADFREWFVEGSGGRAQTRRTHRKEQTKSKQRANRFRRVARRGSAGRADRGSACPAVAAAEASCGVGGRGVSGQSDQMAGCASGQFDQIAAGLPSEPVRGAGDGA